MAGAIEVDFDQMEETLADLVLERTGLRTATGTLREEVRILLASWEGAAADAYELAQSDWLTQADMRIADLEAAIRTLQVVLHRYRSTEATIVAMCS